MEAVGSGSFFALSLQDLKRIGEHRETLVILERPLDLCLEAIDTAEMLIEHGLLQGCRLARLERKKARRRAPGRTSTTQPKRTPRLTHHTPNFDLR
jgi:hypothetical protein